MNKLVSLITRTQNRPILIPRVFKTVIEQSYRPIEWIIVNDNGENIDNLLEELKIQYKDQLDGIEIVLVNKKHSTGMEGASNTGLEHAHGFYIKLLDDDDTLDVTCIEKQVYYMIYKKLPNERGVICYTNNIFEKIEDNQIHFLSSSPLALKPENITILDLARHNQFTVHSFLYEKEALANIGKYNESLPVLGDWEFNLRFLMTFDIGVVPEFLVNYHIRKEGHHSNTITNQRNRHLRYEAVIRNYIVRHKEKYGELVTAILNAQSTKWLQQKIDSSSQTAKKQSLLEAQLFLDVGDGITEKSSIKLPVIQKNDTQVLVFDLDGYVNINRLRFDPLNDSCVIEIEELKIRYQNGIELNLIPRINSNACIHDDKCYFFEHYDPQITFEGLTSEELTGSIQFLVSIHYVHIAKNALKWGINKTKTELKQKNQELVKVNENLQVKDSELKQKNQELVKVNENLQVKDSELKQKNQELVKARQYIDSLKNELTLIYTGKSWRITKPLRKLKKLLKGNKS